MKYLSVTVTTTSECADIVALILIEEGSEGASVKDSADITECLKTELYWDYIDRSLLESDGRVYVTGGFAEDYDISALAERLEALRKTSEVDTGSLALDVKLSDSADYENEWKKYYKPLDMGGVVIIPAWFDASAAKVPAVRLNPGKAFGTGMHETTSMCVSLMQEVDLGGKSVLDAGCGSGILGLAALRLGAESCTMYDIDVCAVDAAAENAELNGLTDKVDVVLGEPQDGVMYDIVLANLTTPILLQLKDKLAASLKPCGRLIVSGIIDGTQSQIPAAFATLRQVKTLKTGEWHAFLFEK